MLDTDTLSSQLPQDLVAIFHASFHPTRGNVLDWTHTADPALSFAGLEFNCLPSGLHLVEHDVVYFSHGPHAGVCVFRRRATAAHGHRGFRLSSLGVLLAPAERARPWRHVRALKTLVGAIYAGIDARGLDEPSEDDWAPAKEWFLARQAAAADPGAGTWHGWPAELDGIDADGARSDPALHLPHLLRILGPSAFTLYKHILGRRRILIFTLPPVEAACVLCHVAADFCFEDQVRGGRAASPGPSSGADGVLIEGLDAPPVPPQPSAPTDRLTGRHRGGLKVLGMVTLSDLDKMEREGRTGAGWVACTTDAIFLERPAHYDLLIDLTTSTPDRASRPTMHVSVPVPPKSPAKPPSYTLSLVRSSWSDVKLWTELDRILKLDAATHEHIHACCSPGPGHDHNGAKRRASSATSPSGGSANGGWTADVWRIYEDVCVICAGLWLGGWRRNSLASYSSLGAPGGWGAPRADADEDLTIAGAYVRAVGRGIEGGVAREASAGSSGSSTPNKRGMRRTSAMSGASGASGAALLGSGAKGTAPSLSAGGGGAVTVAEEDEDEADRSARQTRTTLALLQTLHAHTRFTLETLRGLLARAAAADGGGGISSAGGTLELGARDLLAFELGPLSALDARFVEWLADEYAPPPGIALTVRRSWRELIGAVLGL